MSTRAENEADTFNRAHPVGTPVWYYPIDGEPERRASKVAQPAFVAYSDHSVCFIEGTRGWVLTSHVRFREPGSDEEPPEPTP